MIKDAKFEIWLSNIKIIGIILIKKFIIKSVLLLSWIQDGGSSYQYVLRKLICTIKYILIQNKYQLFFMVYQYGILIINIIIEYHTNYNET